MAKRIDLTGQRFGRLVVISYNEEVSKQKKGPHWNCICDCGNEKVVWGSDLKRGKTQSCGCFMREKVRELNEQRWQDEEFRQKQTNVIKQRWQNEEIRQEQSNKMRERWKDEEFRQTISEQVKEQWQDEEFRQMRSNQMKEQWQDEEIKWKMGYKGGITSISQHLRNLAVVGQWRKNAYEQANYRCQLTGKKVHGGNSDVHHLYGLNMIVLDAHNTYNIEVKPQVKDYTDKELKLLEEYVAEWHKNGSNAVVLSEEVHDLFHQEYGYGNNTPEQYEEFTKSFKK